MNRDLEEKVIRFLKSIANDDNWDLEELVDEYGDFQGSNLSWTKEYYDPSFVAQELLDLLGE